MLFHSKDRKIFKWQRQKNYRLGMKFLKVISSECRSYELARDRRGIAAAKSKHNVVMSPNSHCYFDHYQGLSGEPKAFGGYTPIEKVYLYEPCPKR
jgi:N-acetyl-beta-hexosaminidase